MSDFSFPYSFECLNEYNGRISPSGTVQGDQTTFYLWRCLYHRLLSVFRFALPEDWNKSYFENVLLMNGYVGIVNTESFGVIPQLCTLYGRGLYLQPTEIIVAQPLVQFRGTIGEDCELVRLTPDYLGILDIVDHYAKLLAEVYTSIDVSLKLSRAGLVAYAKNKSAAETLKSIVEKLTSGEPLVVADKVLKTDSLEDEPLFMQGFDVAHNYIGTELLENMTKILQDFDREIGIPIIDDKKERRVVSEVAAATSDAGARITTWKEMLDVSIGKVNSLFGLNISYTCTADELEPVQEEEVTEE